MTSQSSLIEVFCLVPALNLAEVMFPILCFSLIRNNLQSLAQTNFFPLATKTKKQLRHQYQYWCKCKRECVLAPGGFRMSNRVASQLTRRLWNTPTRLPPAGRGVAQGGELLWHSASCHCPQGIGWTVNTAGLDTKSHHRDSNLQLFGLLCPTPSHVAAIVAVTAAELLWWILWMEFDLWLWFFGLVNAKGTPLPSLNPELRRHESTGCLASFCLTACLS